MAITAAQNKQSFSTPGRFSIVHLPDLTAEERREAIEIAVRHTGERAIRKSRSRGDALDACRRHWQWGLAAHGWNACGSPDGVIAWFEEWEQESISESGFPRYRFVRALRSSFIPWGEIVDFIRLGTTVAVQSALF